MSLTLLGGSVSPFVRKIRVVLAEKGLDYEHEQVNPFSAPPGWREISPLGRIPAFKDGDRIINDSSVIAAYLEKKFPKPALYPSDPYDYARALWFEEFMDGARGSAAGPEGVLRAGAPAADVRRKGAERRGRGAREEDLRGGRCAALRVPRGATRRRRLTSSATS